MRQWTVHSADHARVLGCDHVVTGFAANERCREDLDRYELDPPAGEVIRRRLGQILEALEGAPKTRRWKRRARLGERKRWYDEPEEGQARNGPA